MTHCPIRRTLIALLALSVSVLAAEPTSPMEFLLWSDGAPGAVGSEPEDRPSLTVFLPAKDKANGAAVIICPGGGYGHLAVDHEGKQVGQWLNSLGVAGFMLKYRIAPRYHHPAPILDAQRAIRTVRARADEWNLDPKRIGIIGFSAGGHLASTAATHFDAGKTDAADPIDRVGCRPNFAILGYPVISFDPDIRHNGSMKNLLGSSPDPKLVTSLSNELQVTAQTPPTFLFHTQNDKAVPVENSIRFFQALRKYNIPCEMHLYEDGPHGVGMREKTLPVKSWPNLCADWLAGRGILKGPEKHHP